MSLKIKKNTVEILFLIFMFLISFINTFTLFLFFVSLLLLFRQGGSGALKIIILIFIRTIINPELAVSIGALELVKMGLLSLTGLYLVSKYNDVDSKYKSKLNPILLTLLIFSAYNVLVALFISSLPTISISKNIFYVLVFSGVLIGVASTVNKFNVYFWLRNCLSIVMYASLVTMPFPFAYETNGRAFQGILTHPNMFGIFSVLYLALILSRKIKSVDYITIIATVLMISLSDSRTALISAATLLILKVLTSISYKPTFLKLASLSFGLALIVLFYRSIKESFLGFIAKGGSIDNILLSRESQIGDLMFNIQQSPIFGNGFSTPILPYRSFSFSTDAIVEPGNLILAVLSYSGIIGFIIFSSYILLIMFSNKENMLKRITLVIAPLLISMGEMVFFSSNSIGPLCYLLFAIYIIYDENKYENYRVNSATSQ